MLICGLDVGSVTPIVSAEDGIIKDEDVNLVSDTVCLDKQCAIYKSAR